MNVATTMLAQKATHGMLWFYPCCGGSKLLTLNPYLD